jgi:hypothetical protein
MRIHWAISKSYQMDQNDSRTNDTSQLELVDKADELMRRILYISGVVSIHL